jgi:hypothetical protein
VRIKDARRPGTEAAAIPPAPAPATPQQQSHPSATSMQRPLDQAQPNGASAPAQPAMSAPANVTGQPGQQSAPSLPPKGDADIDDELQY